MHGTTRHAFGMAARHTMAARTACSGASTSSSSNVQLASSPAGAAPHLRAAAPLAPHIMHGSPRRLTPQHSRQLFTRVLGMAKGFGFGNILAGPKMLNKKPLLTPRKIAPKLSVPSNIGKPPYADSGAFPPWSSSNQVHDKKGVEKMRASGKLAARVLEYAGSLVKPGVTTNEIDMAVHQMIIDNGAYPSPLNYGAFPKSVCTSVNECVCHGIPDDRPLEEGDIVNIDVTVFLDGHHGDTSRMFYVGEVSDEAKKLCETTRQALNDAIKVCKPGVPYKAIGSKIHNLADKHKFGVVRDYVGHGVGKAFHSAPTITHFRNNGSGVMQPWQTFTIEPMLVEGSIKCKTWKDKWTVVTEDGGLCAQWEHTLLITPDGCEILTAYDGMGIETPVKGTGGSKGTGF